MLLRPRGRLVINETVLVAGWPVPGIIFVCITVLLTLQSTCKVSPSLSITVMTILVGALPAPAHSIVWATPPAGGGTMMGGARDLPGLTVRETVAAPRATAPSRA